MATQSSVISAKGRKELRGDTETSGSLHGEMGLDDSGVKRVDGKHFRAEEVA